MNHSESPPTTLGGTLRRVGPGMVLAGSIVGSGELIATTVTGARAGFWLLWLIIIGCVIKVFVQVELGRFAVAEGKTTLSALNLVPGPRAELQLGKRSARGNWIVWFWFLMFLASLAQLGGIVGGVGQALAISWPLTGEGRAYNAERSEYLSYQVKVRQLAATEPENAAKIARLREEIAPLEEAARRSERRLAVHTSYQEAVAKTERYRKVLSDDDTTERAEELRRELRELETEVAALETELQAVGPLLDPPDHHYWAAIVTAITVFMLVLGRYGFIERFSMVLVGSFTAITIGNVVLLQFHEDWAVRGSDFVNGLSFQVPELTAAQKLAGLDPLATALATFGIIGVGAAELLAYPYWCLEKGYARWTGRRDASVEWLSRARGWLRVMQWDVWCSMVVYTIATVAFYLLGAAILHRVELEPEGTEMIRTLAVMYEPVFGSAAQALFLFGAFAVLYSTFFVANAAHTRLATDVISVLGFARPSERGRRRILQVFGAAFPLTCLAVYVLFTKPVALVLVGAVMQALMLPMLGIAALYFRYRLGDQRLAPGKLWDAMLWLSFLAFVVVGLYLAYQGYTTLFG